MRSTFSLIAATGWLALTSGCAAGDKSGAESAPSVASGGADASATTSMDSAATSTSPPEAEPPPAWFGVDATLSITGGEGTLLEISHTFFDDQQQLLCEVSWLAEPLVPLDLPQDEPILAWWEAALVEPVAEAPCPTTLPLQSTFVFGVGTYDSRLDPARAALGLDGARPLALYTEGSDGQIWLAGVAATEAQLAGLEEADDMVLQDGDYEMVTLFLLPWQP